MRFSASVTEVARHFADYINRVAFRGEHFVLMGGKRAVAHGLTMVTYNPREFERVPGLALQSWA